MRVARMYASEERRAICIPWRMTLVGCCASEWMWREKKSGWTHVKCFKVFAHFGNELFSALITLLEVFIGRIGLGKGKEGEGGV